MKGHLAYYFLCLGNTAGNTAKAPHLCPLFVLGFIALAIFNLFCYISFIITDILSFVESHSYLL
jgi:uncharacterized membrane protein YadS